MYDLDSPAEAKRISEAALQLLDAYGLSTTPNFFRLMYDYVSDRDPVITRALTQASEESNARFRRVAIELVTNHYGQQRLLNLLTETGTSISEIVGRSAGHLEEAGNEARSFGSELDGFAGQLDEVSTEVRVGTLIEQMITSTRRMQARCQKLESDLGQSGVEIGNLRSKLEESRAEAVTDKLTGITNRAGFDATLTQTIAEARSEDFPMSLVMCDIDHFKQFNDSYGHQVGDQVLRLVGGILKKSLKGQDTPCRYGGEEFALILPRTGLVGATAVANDIREIISRKRIIRRSTGEEISRVTMSFGVAELENADDGSSLLERADTALYHAKHTGRNRVCDENDVRPATQASGKPNLKAVS